MHLVLRVWKTSNFYNSTSRLAVLMREVCNALIHQAQSYISGQQVFEMIAAEEAGRAVTMLRTSLRVHF